MVIKLTGRIKSMNVIELLNFIEEENQSCSKPFEEIYI